MDATICADGGFPIPQRHRDAYLLIEPVVDSNGVITSNFYGNGADRVVTVSKPEISDVKQPGAALLRGGRARRPAR